MKQTELAWAAGFFDGEGCISLFNCTNSSTCKRLIIDISQVNKEPLNRFQRAVKMGKVSGPYGPYRKGQKAHYRYRLYQWKKIEQLMLLLWKYLSKPKKDQAKKAIQSRRKNYENIEA